MNIFDWRAKTDAQAIALGIALSTFWAAQHPLQGPLYKILGGDLRNFLEALLYAEIFVIPLYFLLILLPSVRAGAWLIWRNRLAPHLFVPPIIGVAGLLLYALAQTKIDGTQVSIILASSPATMILFMYLTNNYSLRAAIDDAIKSKLLCAHLSLILVIASLAWLGGAHGAQPINWSFALILLLVPGFYFASSSYIKIKIGKSYSVHLAAVVTANLIGASVFSLLIYFYLTSVGHRFMANELQPSIVVMFAIGSFLASFLGLITYNINLRQSDDTQKTVSLTTHSTPFFSVIIALFATKLSIDSISRPNYYQLLSALFVFLILRYFYNKRDRIGGSH